MNDRAVSLLEQYDIQVSDTRKGRGAILCETDRGLLIFKEYQGNEEKIGLQNRLLEQIKDSGFVNAEELIPTREGAMFVQDADRVKYILKTYCEGRECNLSEEKEYLSVVTELAMLHQGMVLPVLAGEEVFTYSQGREYEKRNRELKKVRRFLQHKSQKSAFEISLLKCYDYFLDEAMQVKEGFDEYRPLIEKENQESHVQLFCHGDYQYHNVLFDGKGWFIINFEKCFADHPIRDLFLYLRKMLEKNNWSLDVGTKIIETYEKKVPICALSRIDLYYRLAYPEKFWKIVNFYYNSGKSWIPDKNTEKLEKLLALEHEKQAFLKEAFRI